MQTQSRKILENLVESIVSLPTAPSGTSVTGAPLTVVKLAAALTFTPYLTLFQLVEIEDVTLLARKEQRNI
jgi:hypothetical protein